MPVLRYFVVVGLALLGLLFAADHFMPKPAAVAAVAGEPDDTLANWRASEARKSVHARSAATNNFTQSYAMFAPSPAFGLTAHDEAAFDLRAASDASPKSDNKADAIIAAARPAGQDVSRAQDSPRKPRRHQVTTAAATSGRSLVPPPSADSLRQDAMARAAFAQQQRPLFAQPHWPQQPGFREANARVQGPFGPRMW